MNTDTILRQIANDTRETRDAVIKFSVRISALEARQADHEAQLRALTKNVIRLTFSSSLIGLLIGSVFTAWLKK